MVDYGKSTDNLLDQLLTYRKNRDNTRAWLELYAEANLITPEVSTHLWEVLSGVDASLAEEAELPA